MQSEHPSTETDEDSPSEPYYRLFDALCYDVRVCSNCFRLKRGNTTEDFYRTSGGSNSELRAEFCDHDGTAPPWADGTVSETWDYDPLPTYDGDGPFGEVLHRLFDRLEEFTDAEIDRDSGESAALSAKTDENGVLAGKDRECFVRGLEAALDSADVDLS